MSTKRRSNGEGSIKQRADGRWEARYSLGFNPKTGKPVRKSIYGKTRKEVRDKLIKTLAEIADGKHYEPTKMLLRDWLEFWLNMYSCDKKYSTLKGYRASINKHINPALGNVFLENITPMMVQMFYNSLNTPDKNGKVLSPKSIKNVHIVLRAAMNQAVENDMIRRNPCHNAKLPKVYKTEIRPLTDQQVHDFLIEAEKDNLYGTLLRVILFTGLREAEAMGLTWDCVDFKKGSLTINKQLQRRPQSAGGPQLTPTKNGKPRILRPAGFVMNILQERYEQQTEQRKEAGSAWEAWRTEAEHKKALVFTNEVGHLLQPKRVYLHFKKIAEEVGAPEAKVHDLRHTYAVLSLQNGDDVKTVQMNLGHASAAFTLDVYGHVSDRMQRESAARMEQYIADVSRMESEKTE